MLTITDGASLSRAIDSSIDPRLKELLAQRATQLGGDITNQACFIVIQASDTAENLERELGFSVLTSPCFEWVLDHGFAYEAPIILTDDGYAHVLIVEKANGADADLTALCAACADETV